MSPRLTLLIFIMLGFVACNSVSASERVGVNIYYSVNNTFQSSLANAISKQLDELPLEITTSHAADHNVAELRPATLIIKIGNHKDIDSALDKLDNSIIHINDIETHPAEKTRNKNYFNIQITQPSCRPLALIKSINTSWVRVGYLTTSTDDDALKALETCAGKLGLQIVSKAITNETTLPSSTELVLRESDVLLALPNNKIYNPHSVKNILLSAYRHRIPVIGFSDNFVRAGALAGIYSTVDQIAMQVALIVRQYLDTSASGIYQTVSPSYYSVSVNRQVAKALEVTIKDSAEIEETIRSMEDTQ